MAEYLSNAVQAVSLNEPILFNDSIPCNRGCVYHEDGTGIFTLRGVTNGNACNCFARYQLVFNGNIALPDDGTVAPIAIAISVQGEPRQTSRAIFTPAAVDEYGNVTSTAIITVPRGCCFTASVRAVAASVTETPAPVINVQNANLVINRVA